MLMWTDHMSPHRDTRLSLWAWLSRLGYKTADPRHTGSLRFPELNLKLSDLGQLFHSLLPALSASTFAPGRQTWPCTAPGHHAAAKLKTETEKEFIGAQMQSHGLVFPQTTWKQPQNSTCAHPRCCPSQSSASHQWSRLPVSYWFAAEQRAFAADRGCLWQDLPLIPQTPSWSLTKHQKVL